MLKSLLLGSLLLLALKQNTGRVELTVRDANSGHGVPGVAVTLTFKLPNETAGQAITLVTDPRGLAMFPSLNPGSYVIKVAAEGLDTRSFTDYVLVDPGSQ